MKFIINLRRRICISLTWVGLYLWTPSAHATIIVPSSDDTAAINAIIRQGGQAELANNATPYTITGTLTFSMGARLTGPPGTIIRFSQKTAVFIVPAGAANVVITNVTFDGSKSSLVKPLSSCHAAGFSWMGGGMHYGGPLFLMPGCNGAVVSGIKYDFSSSEGVVIQGAENDKVENSDFDNNLGFGVFVTGGGSNFVITGNRGRSNAIEVIGVGYSGHDGQINQNDIVGSGDNCISVSGRRVTVSANNVSYCLGAGIAIYGDENTVVHNTVRDNGQVSNPAARPIRLWDGRAKEVYHSSGYAVRGMVGIAISGAFGGYGQNNIVEQNTIIDDQPSATQDGIKINTGTNPWKPGAVNKGSYVFANGSTYVALSAGVSSVAPTGERDVGDGQITWRWCSRPILETRQAAGNRVAGNVIKGFASFATRDFTQGSAHADQ